MQRKSSSTTSAVGVKPTPPKVAASNATPKRLPSAGATREALQTIPAQQHNIPGPAGPAAVVPVDGSKERLELLGEVAKATELLQLVQRPVGTLAKVQLKSGTVVSPASTDLNLIIVGTDGGDPTTVSFDPVTVQVGDVDSNSISSTRFSENDGKFRTEWLRDGGASLHWEDGTQTIEYTVKDDVRVVTVNGAERLRSSNVGVTTANGSFETDGPSFSSLSAIGVGRLTLHNGTVSGQFLDGLPHGQASVLVQGLYSYVGEWLKGKRQGRGSMKDRDGQLVYSGNFSKDLPDGHGDLIVTRAGCTLRGSFAAGEPFGELVVSSGTALQDGSKPRDDPVAVVNPAQATVAFVGAAGEFKGKWSLRLSTSPNSSWTGQFTTTSTLEPPVHRAFDEELSLWVSHQQQAAGLQTATAAVRSSLESTILSLKASAIAVVSHHCVDLVGRDVALANDHLASERRAKAKLEELTKDLNASSKRASAESQSLTAAKSRCQSAQAQLVQLQQTGADENASDGTVAAAVDDAGAINLKVKLLDERYTSAAKRLAASRLGLKNAKALAAALEKRIEAQKQALRDQTKQLELTEASRASAEQKLQTTRLEYDAKAQTDKALLDAERQRLADAEAKYAEAKAKVDQLEHGVDLIDGEGDEATEGFTQLEEKIATSENLLRSTQHDLDEARRARDDVAASLAVQHQREKECTATQAATERQVEGAREALRKKRQSVEDRQRRVDQLEETNAKLRPNTDHDGDDEATMLTRHKRSMASFQERKRKTLSEVESLRSVNDQFAADVQSKLSSASFDRRSPTPTSVASPSPATRKSPPPKKLSSTDASLIADLKAQIAALSASLESTNMEAKRLKELKNAPVCLSINAPTCTTAELKVLQAQLKLTLAEAEEQCKVLKTAIAELKRKSDDRRKALDARRQAARDANGNDWRIKALQEALESRDNRIADLKMQVSRIKQLEAKLATASDTVSGMSASVEVRQQQNLSKQKSDVAWAAARSVALRRTNSDSFTKANSSHF